MRSSYNGVRTSVRRTNTPALSGKLVGMRLDGGTPTVTLDIETKGYGDELNFQRVQVPVAQAKNYVLGQEIKIEISSSEVGHNVMGIAAA